MTSETQWRYDRLTWPEMKEVIAHKPQPVVAIPTMSSSVRARSWRYGGRCCVFRLAVEHVQ